MLSYISVLFKVKDIFDVNMDQINQLIDLNRNYKRKSISFPNGILETKEENYLLGDYYSSINVTFNDGLFFEFNMKFKEYSIWKDIYINIITNLEKILGTPGRIHNDNGPAKKDFNEGKWWCKNGEFHREDGPAIEYADGAKYWFKDGKEYFPTEHVKKLYEAGNL